MRRETWPPWLFIATSHMYVWANWRETSIYWVSISLKNIFSLALVGVVFNYHSITASTSPLVLSHLCILLWYLSCHSLLEPSRAEPSRAVIYHYWSRSQGSTFRLSNLEPNTIEKHVPLKVRWVLKLERLFCKCLDFRCHFYDGNCMGLQAWWSNN
jgi:hypothetical protein